MTTPAPPAPSPVRRRAGWDVALSVVFLVFGLLTGVLGAIAQVFFLAFTDYCPQATCHPDQGLANASIVWLVMVIVFIAGIAGTVVLLVTGRRAWWVALIVWLAELGGAVLASALYIAAVG